MEHLRDAKYVHLVDRNLAREGEQFAHVKEEAVVTARKLTGLWAGSPMAGHHGRPQQRSPACMFLRVIWRSHVRAARGRDASAP